MTHVHISVRFYTLELVTALEALAPGLAVASDGNAWWPVWSRDLEPGERRAVRDALASQVFGQTRGAA